MKTLSRWLLKESIIIPLISVFVGLLIGAIIMLFGGYNPVEAYQALFKKAFGNIYGIGETIRTITPLIFTGLAVAFAFRTGLFNIGAEGQFIMGSLAAAYVGIMLDLPAIIHMPLAVIVGGVVGGLWGGIAGYLKASRGVHEVITTIMLNWIALYLSNYLIREYLIEKGQQKSVTLAESSWLSFAFLTDMFNNARIHFGILIALLCAVVFYVILQKMKQGYELRSVGLNPHAAEYAGINVKGNIVKAMVVSGMFAGLGGAVEVLGVTHNVIILPAFQGYGFDGIAVALLGGNTAFGSIVGAFLFGFLSFGATGMKLGAGVPFEIINIVIALVIYFVASRLIFKRLLNALNVNKQEEQ
ncbi:ABC transporter permease [Chengkuizengella axinellae]|uniref:ABC transporter permease n=1 Tax=Chengkuizengella axinellae TaxID=3064388 RepID=A0ABT9IXT9_9BACL|nr:ABC transporter permease [Chengkuizengella sp. 2205SS18-9]MDP5274128.1 ABC transporter permease [Chengkuizengella sp. 2205SS18-9]